MRFLVYDRLELETGKALGDPHVVISVHDPDLPPAEGRTGRRCRSTLTLSFHDIEPQYLPPGAEDDGWQLMTAEDAERIARFVAAHQKSVSLIVCQCEAGMCRSPAIAAAVARALGQDDRRFFRDFDPNRHVYRLILRAMTSAPA